MKKNLMKSAAMGALLLSMAACNGKTSTGEATCCAAAGRRTMHRTVRKRLQE